MTDFIAASPQLLRLLKMADAAGISRYQDAIDWAAAVQDTFDVSVEGYAAMHVNEFAEIVIDVLDGRAEPKGEGKGGAGHAAPCGGMA